MQPHNVLRLVDGKRVELQAPGREPVILNGPPPPPPPPEIDHEAIRIAAERLARMQRIAELDQQHEELRVLLQSLIEGQQRIVDTLRLPVVPKYDEAGRVVEGRRKEE